MVWRAAEADRDKILALETEKARLEAELRRGPQRSEVIAIHPKAVAHYLEQIEELAASIRTADRLEDASVADAFRRLVETVTVYPVPARAPPDVEITGRLAELLDIPALPPGRRWYSGVAMVAEVRFSRSPTISDARFRLRFRPAA